MESSGRNWLIVILLIALGIGLVIFWLRASSVQEQSEGHAVDQWRMAEDLRAQMQAQQNEIEMLREQLAQERARRETAGSSRR